MACALCATIVTTPCTYPNYNAADQVLTFGSASAAFILANITWNARTKKLHDEHARSAEHLNAIFEGSCAMISLISFETGKPFPDVYRESAAHRKLLEPLPKEWLEKELIVTADDIKRDYASLREKGTYERVFKFPGNNNTYRSKAFAFGKTKTTCDAVVLMEDITETLRLHDENTRNSQYLNAIFENSNAMIAIAEFTEGDFPFIARQSSAAQAFTRLHPIAMSKEDLGKNAQSLETYGQFTQDVHLTDGKCVHVSGYLFRRSQDVCEAVILYHDKTENITAEENDHYVQALLEGSNLHLWIVEWSQVGSIIKDGVDLNDETQGRVLRETDSTKTLLGQLGLSGIKELMHVIGHDEITLDLRAMFETGKFDRTVKLPNMDMTVRIYGHAFDLQYTNGALDKCCAACIVEDVTVSERLRYTERQLNGILQNGDALLSLWKINTHDALTSKTIPRDSMLACSNSLKCVMEQNDVSWNDYVETCHCLDDIKLACENGKSVRESVELYHGRFYRSVKYTYGSDGDDTYVLAYLEDITEHQHTKEAKDELSAALGRIRDVVIRVSFEDTDKNALREMNYSSSELSSTFGTTFGNYDGDILDHLLTQCHDTKTLESTIVLVVKDNGVESVVLTFGKGEQTLTIRVSVVAVKAGVIIACIDLTEEVRRIQLETECSKDKDYANALQHHVKNAFSDVEVHTIHLQNDIMRYRANLQIIASKLFEKKTEWIDAIQACDNLKRLFQYASDTIQQLKNASERAKKKVHSNIMLRLLTWNEYKRVDVETNIITELRHEFEYPIFADNIPCVMCDIALLIEILNNALSNAVKYGNGDISIQLEISRESMWDTEIKVTVENGVCKQQCTTAMDATYLLLDKASSGRNSTSIGSNIMRKASDHLCATLELWKYPMCTHFVCRFSCAMVTINDMSEKNRNVCIYCLDDAASQRMVLAAWCESITRNFLVFPTSHVPSKMDDEILGFASVVLRDNPDVVILDQYLDSQLAPNPTLITGTDIAQQLRDAGFAGVVIIRTANATNHLQKKCNKTGAFVICKGEPIERIVGLLTQSRCSPIVDQAFSAEKRDIFTRDGHELIARLKECNSSNAAQKIIHRLKGDAMIYGASKLAAVCEANDRRTLQNVDILEIQNSFLEAIGQA